MVIVWLFSVFMGKKESAKKMDFFGPTLKETSKRRSAANKLRILTEDELPKKKGPTQKHEVTKNSVKRKNRMLSLINEGRLKRSDLKARELRDKRKTPGTMVFFIFFEFIWIEKRNFIEMYGLGEIWRFLFNCNSCAYRSLQLVGLWLGVSRKLTFKLL